MGLLGSTFLFQNCDENFAENFVPDPPYVLLERKPLDDDALSLTLFLRELCPNAIYDSNLEVDFETKEAVLDCQTHSVQTNEEGPIVVPLNPEDELSLKGLLSHRSYCFWQFQGETLCTAEYRTPWLTVSYADWEVAILDRGQCRPHVRACDETVKEEFTAYFDEIFNR